MHNGVDDSDRPRATSDCNPAIHVLRDREETVERTGRTRSRPRARPPQRKSVKTGLDRFGRIKSLDYRGLTYGDPSDLRYSYGYDERGNRTFARIDNPTAESSWQYGYDGLSRLVFAARGEMDDDGLFLPGVEPETIQWDLDVLGNWSGDAYEASVPRFLDADADGLQDPGEALLRTDHHAVNAANEIDEWITVDAFGSNGVQAFHYDDAGNLVFTGRHYFIYDAWNRLAAIHGAGTLAVGTNGLPGLDGLDGLPGACLERFEYDALGRRVRTAVWPDTDDARITEHVYGTGAAVLEEYDIDSNGVATLARWFVHGETFPDPLAMVDRTAAGDWPAGEDEWLYYLKDALGSVGALTNAAGAVVERYAYDPYGRTTVLDADGHPAPGRPTGDGPLCYHDHDFDGDIDWTDYDDLLWCVDGHEADAECVFVHDRNGDRRVDWLDEAILWQDTQGQFPASPQALVLLRRPVVIRFDVDGDGFIDLFDYAGLTACFGADTAVCLAIFDTDADGVVDLEDFIDFAGDLGAPGAPAWPPSAAPRSRYNNPFAWTAQRHDPLTGLYHFWARTYDPALGRFLQEDMMGVLSTVDLGLGFAADPVIGPPYINAANDYLDGLNLYLYVLANPANRVDRYGLLYDDYEDAIDDLTGTKLYALGMLNEGARWASIGLKTTLGIASSLLPGAGLFDVFDAVEVMADGRGGFWEAVTIATAAIPVATFGLKAVGALRGLHRARKYGRMHCNCFVGTTLVETPSGPVPITELDVGDEVCTRHQGEEYARESTPSSEDCNAACDDGAASDDGGAPPSGCARVGRVTRLFRDVAPAIFWVVLSSGDMLGATPDHSVWTHQAGWTTVRAMAVGDTMADQAGCPVVVVDIAVDPTPATVYNLEVDGAYTYFAEGVWVHNTSGCLPFTGRKHGGTWHNDMWHERGQFHKANGMKDVRGNQALRDANGNIIAHDIRPDIQYVDQSGKVWVEELVDTSPPKYSPARLKDLLGDSFGGYKTIERSSY